ncbi:MAG: hypothetical protein A2667_03465 [Candidatus Wildermuthbacteria bacterium RIFCSPHIGHO2_01_FULL_47_27]|uniref:Phosphoribosyltransferase domain-containing protein n=1 Tax=Candidatus Wildermuthbacteria bacterium RIFCSPLOWO2_01_FULL_48_35 TaxID=1802463 RepID=A0A1G2RNM1_9BACT|nr:MAG: Phosphoribosyltransferase [Parcubacteria group bacterium GW2011_GWA2_47_9]OHA63525.1 MAG: hypothetical protein A2667_03465 [Candidatus Wildermuthbacteria bacterium RIFCSPHIGHO2_01_FULL_47_27]OHA74078.1 MAG: hypothetical protein A3A32_02180 [Candidatus Wildermuthbacteria bacterium RIFCSPLOWO2_01_FULL_48_35]OHA75053.1 MAG: hypothetical protein A3I38_03300 [Candidatus Wildermuthbacteria bacterium RIFCSPLOWO2_02_FULL_47_10]
MRQLETVTNLALDIAFPPACANCAEAGKWLCEDCFSLVEIFENQYCPFCVSPKIVSGGGTCDKCRKTKKLNGLFCATTYKNTIARGLIRRLKYPPALAACFAPVLSSFIITHFQLLNKKDFASYLWIAVPLHKKKLKRRGFNQAALIAKELARRLGGDFAENMLTKIRFTPSQVELNREEREQNIAGAFECANPEKVKERDILLVDDVFTTGATLEECAKVLRRAGAKMVWGVVIARE